MQHAGYAKTEPEEPVLLPLRALLYLLFTAPPRNSIFSQDLWTLHKPADSLHNAAVYPTSVDLEIQHKNKP